VLVYELLLVGNSAVILPDFEALVAEKKSRTNTKTFMRLLQSQSGTDLLALPSFICFFCLRCPFFPSSSLSTSVCICLHDLLRNSKFGRASPTKTPIFLQLYSLTASLSFFFFVFFPLEIFIFLCFSIVMCSTIAWIDGFLRNHW
jgi:hypothetical protein